MQKLLENQKSARAAANFVFRPTTLDEAGTTTHIRVTYKLDLVDRKFSQFFQLVKV